MNPFQNMAKTLQAVSWLIVLLILQACDASRTALPQEALDTISLDELREHVRFMASDELGGRYAFSPGNRKTAEYLQQKLESYGYRGAVSGGSFYQPVPVKIMTVDVERSWLRLSWAGGNQQFEYETDYMPEMPNQMLETAAGDLVFVGYGVSAPDHNYDDYAAVDANGKFVVTVKGVPAHLADVELADHEVRNGAARKNGALGNVVISGGLLANYQRFSHGYAKRTLVRLYDHDRQRWLPVAGLGQEADLPDESLQVILAGPELVAALARLMVRPEAYLTEPNGEPRPPKPLAARLEVRTTLQTVASGETFNVLGILEGSDPELKNEYIVLSAHYDHLKTGQDGQIYNGANDNASGVAALLEVAQAFAVGPRPKRSVLVAFYTAEELGLSGSRINTDYQPVVPLDQIVANLNFDMIGYSHDTGKEGLPDANTVFIIGADKISRELDEINRAANRETVALHMDYSLNDPGRRDRIIFRSDHQNYMKHGIPAIWYFTGLPDHYHTPRDDFEEVDFEKMAKIARLALATAWRVTQRSARISADPEFLSYVKNQ